MAKEQFFDQFSDYNKLKKEQERILKLFTEIENRMSDLSKQGIRINFANSIKDIEQSIKQLEKTAAELSVMRKEMAITSSKIIQLKEKENQKTKESVKHTLDEKIQAKERNRELLLEANYRNAAKGSINEHIAAIAILENNLKKLNLTKAEDLIIQEQINKKIAEHNAIIAAAQPGGKPNTTGQQTPQTTQPLDLGTNLDQLEQQNKLLEKQGEVVNDIDKQQVENILSANEWAEAQRGAADATDEIADNTKKISDDIDSSPIIKYKDALEEMTGTLGQNQELLATYQRELKDTQKEINFLTTNTKAAEKATPAYKKRIDELRTTENLLKKEIKDTNFLIKQQTIEMSGTAGQVDKLKARLELLKFEINKMSAVERKSTIGRAFITEAKEIDLQVQKIKKASGQIHDSTNNMSNAVTRSLGRAIGFLRNIAYLIPGIGIAGIIALLYDGIIEFAKALLTGEKAVNSFKEKFLALKDALANGGYKEAVTNIEQLRTEIALAKDGVIDKEKVLQHYNETIGKTTGEVSSLKEAEIALGKNAEAYIKFTLLKAAAQAALAKSAEESVNQMESELDFLEEFTGKAAETGLIKETQKAKPDEVKTDKKGKVEITIGESIVTPQSDAEEQTEKKLKEKQDKARERSRTRIKAFKDLAREFLQDAAIIAKDFDFDFFAGDLKAPKDAADKKMKLYDDILKRQRDAFLKIAKDEDRTVEDRIVARERAYQKEVLLIENKRKVDLFNAQGSKQDILEINKEADDALLDAERQLIDETLRLQNGFINKLRENAIKAKDIAKDFPLVINEQARKIYEEKGKIAQDAHDLELIELENNFKDQNLVLDKQYADGKLKKKEYEAAKLKLQQEYNIKVLEETISNAKKQLEVERQLANLEQDPVKKDERLRAISEAEAKITGLMKDLAALRFKNTQDTNKKTADSFLEMFQKISDAAKATFEIIGGFIHARAEREKNAIQEEIDLLEEKRRKDIETAEQTITNERDKTDAIIRINALADAQKTALETKQRQAQERDARFQKAVTISQIIQDTALAVVRALGAKPYTPANLGLAAITAAFGAAQLAVAIATPIPKYEKGTESAKKGLGIAGEKGRELMVDNKGNLVVFEKPTLTEFSGGEKIYSNKVTEDMLKSNKGVHTMKVIEKETVSAAPDRTDEVLSELRAIKKRVKLVVINTVPIESTPYYLENLKGK